MKNIYKSKASRVHPSQSSPVLCALPEEVRELVTVLSPEEKDVVYYFLSLTVDGSFTLRLRRSPDHSPEMGCACFNCYKTFWERWDRSANRHVIHDILEKVEENFSKASRPKSQKKRGKSHKKENQDAMEFVNVPKGGDVANDTNDNDDSRNCHGDESKNVISRFMRFIGEKLGRIWQFL
ncbi:hypothetical protein LUZ60_002231 [Juncus effusus]|nr:hypothetical protein LUZ60_002231 [Juncus effusus]